MVNLLSGGKDTDLGEGELVDVKTKSLKILPVYEIWEIYCCQSCGSFHYKIRLIEANGNMPLPLEFVCPEERPARLEQSSSC